MIRFVYSSVYTTFRADSPAESSAVTSMLEITDPETKEVKNLYSEDGMFLSGLLPRVISRLESDQIEYEVHNRPEKVSVPVDRSCLKGITLRDYQIRAAEKMLYNRRGLVNIATNGGKSEIYLSILQTLDLPSLVILGRIKHARQMYNRMRLRGITDCTWVRSDDVKDAKHVVSTADTLSRHINSEWVRRLLSSRSILCFDETHHLAARTWQYIAYSCKAEYRYGLSATCLYNVAERYSNIDDMTMIGLTGDIIVDLPLSYLISAGYSTPVEVVFLPIPGPKVHHAINSYDKIYERAIVKNSYRNHVICQIVEDLAKDPSTRTLVIVERIDHGKSLLKELIDRGVKAKFSFGGDTVTTYFSGVYEDTNDPDEKYIEEFLSGGFNTLIGCFSGDTRVPLLDGTESSMRELEGKTFEVYSRNPSTRYIEGAKATCVKTGVGRKLFRITLDNGEFADCTPEHLWMLRDGSYKRADELKEGDSLMPLYRGEYKGYENIYQPEINKYLPTHFVQAYRLKKPDTPRLSGGSDRGGWVIHHKNCNSRDNSIENLEWCRFKDHQEKHGGFGFVALMKDPEYRKKHGELTSKRFTDLWSTEAYRSKQSDIHKKYWTSDKCKEHKKKKVVGLIKFNKSDRHLEQVKFLNSDPEQIRKRFVGRVLSVGRKIIEGGLSLYSWDDSVDTLISRGVLTRFSAMRLRAVIKYLGCVENVSASLGNLNHKVESVIEISTGDVYDITVPGYGNFAISAGVFVHNSSIYDESADIPDITDIILTSAGRSPRRLRQRVGRGVRRKEGKEVFRFWDFRDNSHYMLYHQYNARKKVYVSEGFPIVEEIPEYVTKYGEWLRSRKG